MKILVNNVYSKVIESTEQEKELLIDMLKVRTPGYQWTNAYKNKHWDGYKRFYHSPSKLFLTGFVPLVIEEFLPQNVELIDKRHAYTHLCISEYAYNRLRDYQIFELEKTVYTTLEHATGKLSWLRGIVKQPTGSGKTIFAAALIDTIRLRTLYLVERLDLLYQTRGVLQKELNMDIGLIGDSVEDIQPVTISTVQTINRKLKSYTELLRRTRILMIDECHHVNASSYHKIAIACQNAVFRFGFSGTPLSRGDLGDAYLVGHTGEIISTVDRTELEESGYLAKPIIHVSVMRSVDSLNFSMPYLKAYKDLLTQNVYRNTRICSIVDQELSINANILILVRHVSHGAMLLKLLKSQGVKATYLKGADSATYRKEVLQSLGISVQVIIATTIFDEGIDSSAINCLIMAGGGASKIKSVQRVGRTLRPEEGKTEARVYDFLDTTNKYLLKHSKERIAAYEQEGFEVRISNEEDL